jgi:hypothetical protein
MGAYGQDISSVGNRSLQTEGRSAEIFITAELGNQAEKSARRDCIDGTIKGFILGQISLF